MTHDLEGQWVELPNGRVARIVAVADDAVLAEYPSGRSIDRPLANVLALWRFLSQDSLLVEAASAHAQLAARLEANPVDLVADAIRDLGGEAETEAIQGLLERVIGADVGTGPKFKAWWRKTQLRIGDDPRIDDTRSYERRYRLLGPGEVKVQPQRQLVSDQERLGRLLAVAGPLKSARERVRNQKPPLTQEELEQFAVQATVADMTHVDATDRFLAAELGVWLGLRTQDEAVGLLGEDLLDIDLFRIVLKPSRLVALQWLASFLRSRGDEWSWTGGTVPVILATAIGSSLDWDSVVGPLAAQLEVSRRAVTAAAVAWSYPGSEESRPWKLPADYLSYASRVQRFLDEIPTAKPDVHLGLEQGGLIALAGLAESEKNTLDADRMVERLAELVTRARVRLDDASMTSAEVVGRLPPKRLGALLAVRTVQPGAWARRAYLAAVEAAFRRDPAAYEGVVRQIGAMIGEDPGAIAVRCIRQVVRDSTLVGMALAGGRIAESAAVAAACDALAGTADPDNAAVSERLRDQAGDAAQLVIEGLDGDMPEVEGMRVFLPATWTVFTNALQVRMRATLQLERAAASRVTEAEALLADAEARITQYREQLAGRLQADASSRQISSDELAVNVLKPVARALADSMEAPSLEVLQDNLAALLDKAHIEPTILPGDVASFTSEFHKWVGNGHPTGPVMAISPGFVAHLEGKDVVLVVARVVAAPN